jgi:putative hydrolase of the HAD superfamily
VVVFDIDDTLYLERDYVRSGFEAVGAHVQRRFGVDKFAAAAWALFEGGVRGQTLDLAWRQVSGDPSPAIEHLVRIYREHDPAIELLPDSERTLSDLRHRGVHLAIVTDGPRKSQRAKVAALGLDALVDHVVVTDELGPGRGKPDPAGFEQVEATFGARGRELVYVADNPAKDFVAPASLGWATVRVRRPGALHASRSSPRGVDADVEHLDAALCLTVGERV